LVYVPWTVISYTGPDPTWKVFVTGEVTQPAVFSLGEGLTLTNVIHRVDSSLTEFADRPWVEVRHPDGSRERYNRDAVEQGVTNNPALKHNDVVFIPRRVV
jgi:protein involved in polysaccharide export with SLBB domain